MSFPNKSLISFTFPADSKVTQIQDMLEDICECGEILKCSTVYKQTVTDMDVVAQKLRFVLNFSTYLSAEQMIYLLENNAAIGDPILLAFNQQVTLSPKVTLPYPQLISDGLILRCAAEVLPQYEHPVLNKTLGEVVKTVELKDSAEFVMQGESLIAF